VSARALEIALGACGIAGRVEARGALAILTLDAGRTALADEARRTRALAVAREHGFTHLAVEYLDADDRAALRRD
jgi:hypothetical protein